MFSSRLTHGRFSQALGRKARAWEATGSDARENAKNSNKWHRQAEDARNAIQKIAKRSGKLSGENLYIEIRNNELRSRIQKGCISANPITVDGKKYVYAEATHYRTYSLLTLRLSST